MKITIFIRRPSKNQFSIDKLFKSYSEHLSIKHDVNVSRMPFESEGLLNIFFNLIFACFVAIKSKSDVYHISGDIHYIALFLPTKRTIITIHDTGPIMKNNIKRILYSFFWFKLPSLFVSKIIAISKNTKLLLIDRYKIPPEKIEVIENFYDPNLSKYNFKKTENSVFKIIQVGTKKNKNLEGLTSALSYLNIKDIELTIVGRLSDAQEELLNNSCIKYENALYLENTELYQLISQSDLLVFLSTFEGFGMPIIEAQYLGTAVLASNIEPMLSVGADSCYYADPFNFKDIAHQIKKAYEQRSLSEDLIKKGKLNVQRYHISNNIEQYTAIYKDIVS